MVLALLSAVSTLLVVELSTKSEPAVSLPRPRPAGSKVTPVMLIVELPVSLNTILSWSPFSRLMPLNEESCAVVRIWSITVLYWAIRLARVFCELASFTGAEPAPAVNSPAPVAVPLSAPMVAEPWSLVVVMVSLPSAAIDACRLLAASAVLSWSSVDTLLATPVLALKEFVPLPKVILRAWPPSVAAMSSSRPDRPPVVVPTPTIAVPAALMVVAPSAALPRPAAVPLLRPKFASAEPPSVTPAAVVPELIEIWPLLAPIEAVPAPAIVLIAAITSPTVSFVLIVPPLDRSASVEADEEKVSVLPLTVSVLPFNAAAVPRLSEEAPDVPPRMVALVILAATVLSFCTAEPVNVPAA